MVFDFVFGSDPQLPELQTRERGQDLEAAHDGSRLYRGCAEVDGEFVQVGRGKVRKLGQRLGTMNRPLEAL